MYIRLYFLKMTFLEEQNEFRPKIVNQGSPVFSQIHYEAKFLFLPLNTAILNRIPNGL